MAFEYSDDSTKTPTMPSGNTTPPSWLPTVRPTTQHLYDWGQYPPVMQQAILDQGGPEVYMDYVSWMREANNGVEPTSLLTPSWAAPLETEPTPQAESIWGAPTFDPNYGWVQTDQYGNVAPWQGDIPENTTVPTGPQRDWSKYPPEMIQQLIDSDTTGAMYQDYLLWMQSASGGQWDPANVLKPTWLQEDKYGGIQYDANGNAYQIAPDGSIHYTGGQAPTGAATNAPSQFAGWGQEWGQSTQYNPTTGKMETAWNKTPMSAENTLAQGQWANLPSSWMDVGIMNRVLPQGERRYDTSVGADVGRLVGAKQGYGSQFDLQQGQWSGGITPSGWLGENWQQGYPQQGTYVKTVAGPQTAPLQTGGYQTLVPSMQDWGRMGYSGQQELGGWLNSGLSGYQTPEDYYQQMYKLAAPSGGGTRLSYR